MNDQELRQIVRQAIARLGATPAPEAEVAEPPRRSLSDRLGSLLNDLDSADARRGGTSSADAPAAHGVDAGHVEDDAATVDHLKQDAVARGPLGPHFGGVRSCHAQTVSHVRQFRKPLFDRRQREALVEQGADLLDPGERQGRVHRQGPALARLVALRRRDEAALGPAVERRAGDATRCEQIRDRYFLVSHARHHTQSR